MRLFGLIGFPLTHSFSQRYFTEKFAREGIADARYELFPLEKIDMLPGLLEKHPELCGLNVTIPYKESVRAYLDELDPTAAAVGAVNVIRIQAGKRTGFNTDVYGFEMSLRHWLEANGFALERDRLHGLILGTGGAAKAVAWVLAKMGFPFHFVSRREGGENTLTYPETRQLLDAGKCLIVNTTPLGTYPAVDTCPDIPFRQLNDQHFVYDLVYNPAETLLLQRAKQHGCPVINGLEMLHLQAEQAWKCWNGTVGDHL